MSEFSERAKRARRMAERRIRGLVEASSKSSGRKQEYYQEQIEHYNYVLEQTRMYEGGRRIKDRTLESRRAAVEELESLNERNVTYREYKTSTTANKMSNRQFAGILRMVASGVEMEDIGYTEVKLRAFFRATQKAWEGKPSNKRYEAILDYYGADSLQEVWDAVMDKNAEVLAILDKRQRGEKLSAEELEFVQNLISKEGIDKKYSLHNENSPLVGSIASNILELERDFS